ncbi:MAG: MinD/ParA family protein [Desulfovermiculus sp.]
MIIKQTIHHSDDQAQALREFKTQGFEELMDRETKSPQVISITSGKGGVGKTSVVSNLAVTWAKRGKKILIIDADLGLANIDVVFGLSPRYTLNHFFANKRGLKEIMIEGPHGIKILPAGSGVQQYTTLIPADHLRFIEELDGLNNDFDLVLVDTGAGISESVTYFSTAAQTILVVTTPQITAITDAYALIKLLALRYHEKNFYLLVNTAKSESEALEVYEKLTTVTNSFLGASLDFVGWLPHEKRLNDALSQQQAFVDLYPKSRLGSSCQKIIDKLQSDPGLGSQKGSPQFFWSKLLRLCDWK